MINMTHLKHKKHEQTELIQKHRSYIENQYFPSESKSPDVDIHFYANILKTISLKNNQG